MLRSLPSPQGDGCDFPAAVPAPRPVAVAMSGCRQGVDNQHWIQDRPSGTKGRGPPPASASCLTGKPRPFRVPRWGGRAPGSSGHRRLGAQGASTCTATPSGGFAGAEAPSSGGSCTVWLPHSSGSWAETHKSSPLGLPLTPRGRGGGGGDPSAGCAPRLQGRGTQDRTSRPALWIRTLGWLFCARRCPQSADWDAARGLGRLPWGVRGRRGGRKAARSLSARFRVRWPCCPPPWSRSRLYANPRCWGSGPEPRHCTDFAGRWARLRPGRRAVTRVCTVRSRPGAQGPVPVRAPAQPEGSPRGAVRSPRAQPGLHGLPPAPSLPTASLHGSRASRARWTCSGPALPRSTSQGCDRAADAHTGRDTQGRAASRTTCQRLPRGALPSPATCRAHATQGSGGPAGRRRCPLPAQHSAPCLAGGLGPKFFQTCNAWPRAEHCPACSSAWKALELRVGPGDFSGEGRAVRDRGGTRLGVRCAPVCARRGCWSPGTGSGCVTVAVTCACVVRVWVTVSVHVRCEPWRATPVCRV